MISPDPAQFRALASTGSYDHIPMRYQVLADLETPLSTYLKLGHGPYSYLFESVQGGETWGRYSIIGLPARRAFRFYGNTLQVLNAGAMVEERCIANPFAEIEALWKRYQTPKIPDMPRFTGGLVGYFGYDSIAHIEPRLARTDKPDMLHHPEILLLLSEEVLVFDNLHGRLHIIIHAQADGKGAWQTGARRLRDLHEQLLSSRLPPMHSLHAAPAAGQKQASCTSNFKQQEFENAVQRCKDYIRDGDIMQVVLSQRLSAPFHAEAIDLYRALRCLNPSPYMYYLHLDDFHIVGSSPEILVRLEQDLITVRPIAGTRLRGKNEQQDQELEQELLSDPKELAEHLMLIDLGRNDIGRVAKTGTVCLTDRMTIERYSHVMHIVSNVTASIRPGLIAVDVLRAAFPAGTVSGAPKIRAMEIIAELEPDKRGIYAGAIGYLDWQGNMDTAIVIRTAVIQGQTMHVQAGAGIVADSDPTREWQETLDKSQAIFSARDMLMTEGNADAADDR